MYNSKPVFDALREFKGSGLTQTEVDEMNVILNGMIPSQKALQISDAGVALIKQFEGLRLTAYLDSVGIWTIGYGTTVYPNGKKVAKGDTCTEAQANEFKANDLKKFVPAVSSLIQVPVTQNQFDALVSLTYNIGVGAIGGSTLIKKLNAKDYKGAAEQFLVWNKGRVNGVLQVIPGLTNRRIKEKAYFEK
jgi:lysozyme